MTRWTSVPGYLVGGPLDGGNVFHGAGEPAVRVVDVAPEVDLDIDELPVQFKRHLVTYRMRRYRGLVMGYEFGWHLEDWVLFIADGTPEPYPAMRGVYDVR